MDPDWDLFFFVEAIKHNHTVQDVTYWLGVFLIGLHIFPLLNAVGLSANWMTLTDLSPTALRGLFFASLY